MKAANLFFCRSFRSQTVSFHLTQKNRLLDKFLQNLGLIWFIVPVSMIVCNDVMAYLFGFFFGRTPLIKLSPKKTWEGFIGGGFATVIFGVAFSYVLCQYQFFICPIEYNEDAGRMAMECEPSYLFRPQEYTIPFVRKTKKFSFLPLNTNYFLMRIFHSINIFFIVENPQIGDNLSVYAAFAIDECF